MRIVTMHCLQTGLAFGPVKLAESPWERTRGLLGRERIVGSEGMLITRCRSVHTVGMGYPIDVVFLSNDGRIQRIVDSLRPMRMAMSRLANCVLELPAGQARKLALRRGLELSGWQEKVKE